jgi:hypothetical protein
MNRPILACKAFSLTVLIFVSLSGTGAHALGLNDLNTNLNNNMTTTTQQLPTAPGSVSNLSQVSRVSNQASQTQILLNNGKQAGQDNPNQKGYTNLDANQIQLKVKDKVIGQTTGTVDMAKAYGQVVNHTNLVTASGVTVKPDGSILLVQTGADEKTNIQANPNQSGVNVKAGLHTNVQAKANRSAPQPKRPVNIAQATPKNSMPNRQVNESAVQDPVTPVNASVTNLAQKQQKQAVDVIHTNAFATNRKTTPWGVNIVTTHNKLQETTRSTSQTVPGIK